MKTDTLIIVLFCILLVFMGIQMRDLNLQIDQLGESLSDQLEELQRMKDGGS